MTFRLAKLRHPAASAPRPQPGSLRRRLAGAALGCAALAAGLSLGPAVRAAEGDTQSLIYIGTGSVAIEGTATTGTTFGVRWGYEFYPDLLWTIGGAFGATDGTQRVANVDYAVRTNSSELQTGLLYFIGRAPDQLVTPFLGGGVSWLDYSVDYRFPASKVGKTSGSAPGGFALAGVELWLARSLTFIVSYEAEAYQIRRQGGGSSTWGSGGVLLALRLNLYSG